MTGAEHYREAEQVLAQVKDRDVSAAEVAAYTAVAQVHATLALTAIAADMIARGSSQEGREWRKVMFP